MVLIRRRKTMTDREKAIIMAYTGTCMLTEEKFHIFHEYIEDLMGRPVFTHELANKKVQDEIKEKSKVDFLKLCDEPESCDDSVSRKALITALNEMDRYIANDMASCESGDIFPMNEVFIVDDVYEKMEMLRPVRPVACVATVKFNKEDMQKIVDEKVKEMTEEEMPEHTQIEAMVNYYGANDRLRLLMEECGELVQAANKILRYPSSDKVRANLLEEMVDVSIMIEQIRTLFDYSESEWSHMMQYKVNRCKKRFEEDKYYTKKASDKK
jgi:NTP pyrophosphatase (non-canonical NTP hydrolase)